MRKKFALLMVMAVVLTVATNFAGADDSAKVVSATEYQAFNFVKGTVTASVLNVRQGPSTSHEIVNKLQKGSVVNVMGKIGDWYTVFDMKGGYIGAVHANYLDVGDAVPTATVPISIGDDNTVTIVDETPASAEVVEPSADEKALLDLVNKARKDAKVGELKLDPTLTKLARLKAQEMVDKGYFSHESPTYGSPFDMMRKQGVTFKCAGENIAGNKTVEAAFNKWMKDEKHKKNILNAKFTVTGIGVVEDKTYGKIIVQQFVGK